MRHCGKGAGQRDSMWSRCCCFTLLLCLYGETNRNRFYKLGECEAAAAITKCVIGRRVHWDGLDGRVDERSGVAGVETAE